MKNILLFCLCVLMASCVSGTTQPTYAVRNILKPKSETCRRFHLVSGMVLMSSNYFKDNENTNGDAYICVANVYFHMPNNTINLLSESADDAMHLEILGKVRSTCYDYVTSFGYGSDDKEDKEYKDQLAKMLDFVEKNNNKCKNDRD